MNKKFLPTLVVVIGFAIFFIVVYLLNHNQVMAPSTTPIETTSQSEQTSPPNFVGNEDAFKNALNLYIQKKQEGIDMTNGPCLGKIANDWVLDIAHEPRTSEDEKEENQCPEYLNGTAKHFIEMSPEGKLLRFK